MARTTDRQVVNGQEYMIMDSQARENISNLKNELGQNTETNYDIPSFTIGDADIELGSFSDGEETDATNRARNKTFIPVNKGNVVLSFQISNTAFTYAILYYDEDKTFIEQSNWIGFSETDVSDIESDGYIRIIFNPSNQGHTQEEVKGYFKNAITVLRQKTNELEESSLGNRIDPNQFIRTVGLNEIELCAINSSNGKIGKGSSRGATPMYIPINEDDSIIRKTGRTAEIICFYDKDFNFVRSNASTYDPFDNVVYPQEGEAYIRIGFQHYDTNTPTREQFADIITIIRFGNRNEMLTSGLAGRIEYSKAADCEHGYINENSGAISPHSYYMVTRRFFRVHPGDIVRCKNNDLNIWVAEYDLSLSLVRHSSGYVRMTSKNPYPAGEWHVNTDGYVRACFTNYNAQTVVDIEEYGDSLEIVHSIYPLNNSDAYAQKLIGPTNYIKPRKIREGQDRGAQAGVIIDGYLYLSVDDYAGNYSIQKVNIQTGETIKTYTHNLGHCSCLDYCEETDTLLTWDRGIVLYPNFSNALQNDSFSINDCVVIYTDMPHDSSWCFGEDPYTIYGFCGYDSGTGERKNIAYKVQLGYGENDLSTGGYGTYTESDSYNGTAKKIKNYTGEIREYHDGLFGAQNASYAQDVKYDGYMYLCYGTNGYNCIIIDFDDLSDMYKVVGNYKWVYRSSDYTDLKGEAEAVALNGTRIVSVLRDWAENISCMIEFTRT